MKCTAAPNTTNTTDREHDEVFHHSWVYYLKLSFLVVAILAIAFVNGLVVWALKRFVSLRKPSNVFIGGLAIADFCMVVPLLLKIVQQLTCSRDVCVAQGVTELITVSCISLHLACISVERFVSIKYCMRYDSIVTKRRVYTCLAVLWVISILFVFVIPVVKNSREFKDFADAFVTLCSRRRQPRMRDMPERMLIYSIVMLIVFFAVPCATIMLSNAYIFIASARQRRKIITQQIGGDHSKWGLVTKRLLGDLKAARTVFFIQVLFVLAYYPYFAVSLYRSEMSELNEKHFYRISKGWSFLTALTSFLNPVIYISGNEQFRRAFRKLLGIGKKENKDSCSSGRAGKQT